MLDLRRFPVSDGAGVKCCTFCTILDRKHFLEMSEIEFLFDWRQSRTAARPPCGLKPSLKIENN